MACDIWKLLQQGALGVLSCTPSSLKTAKQLAVCCSFIADINSPESNLCHDRIHLQLSRHHKDITRAVAFTELALRRHTDKYIRKCRTP